jgi:hypothetical protein
MKYQTTDVLIIAQIKICHFHLLDEHLKAATSNRAESRRKVPGKGSTLLGVAER